MVTSFASDLSEIMLLICAMVQSLEFVTTMEVICSSCTWKHQSFLCQKNVHKKSTRSPFEVNLRAVTAWKGIGKGHSGIESFCRCMNMKGIFEAAYRKLRIKFSEANENSVDASVEVATSEARTSRGEQFLPKFT